MSATLHAAAPQADLGQQRYDAVFRTFHWLVVALVLTQLTIALVLPNVLPQSAKDSITAWHLSVGSTVLLVMLLRLAWRLTHAVPPPPSDLSPGLQLLARGTHLAFYAVLIVLPLLGWTAANAYGGRVHLMGLIPLPMLVSPDKAFAESVGMVHKSVALVLLALIALHVSGALFHALVKRDGVVRRMLPG